MSINRQLAEAKYHIENKEYDRAYSILEQVNHPTAEQWLSKLDEIELVDYKRQVPKPTNKTVIKPSWKVILADGFLPFWLAVVLAALGYNVLTEVFSRPLNGFVSFLIIIIPPMITMKITNDSYAILDDGGIKYKSFRSRIYIKWHNLESIKVRIVSSGEGSAYEFKLVLKKPAGNTVNLKHLFVLRNNINSTPHTYKSKRGLFRYDKYTIIDPDKLVKTLFGQYLLYYAPHIIVKLRVGKRATSKKVADMETEKKKN